MNLLRLIRKPGIALSAMVSGWNRYYEAAKFYNPDRTWIDPTPKDDYEALDPWSRKTLCGLAMRLYSNVGFVKGAVDDIAMHAVGSGIFPHSAIVDEAIATQYDDYFNGWAEICEVQQRFDFWSCQELVSKTLDVGGDCGFILTETQNSFAQIQAIEPHRIESESDDGYVDGVKLNSDGRPVAYKIKYRDKDGNERYEAIPASGFVHVYEPDRLVGVRSASGLAHGIDHIRDRKDIIGFEKIGVKLASSMGLLIKQIPGTQTPGGFFSGQQQQTGSGGSTFTQEQLRAGAIPRLNVGESIETVQSNRPSPTFTGFLDYIDRDVAAGLGVPVEFIWNAANLSGTGQRLILEKAQKRFEHRQRTIMRMTRRIRNYVIAKGVKRGDLPSHPDWWRINFQPPSKITVDVGRESKADREDYWSGLRTIQEDYGGRGKGWKNARKDNETAARDLLARAAGIRKDFPELTMQEALNLLEKRGNQGSAARQPGGTADAATSDPAQ